MVRELNLETGELDSNPSFASYLFVTLGKSLNFSELLFPNEKMKIIVPISRGYHKDSINLYEW